MPPVTVYWSDTCDMYTPTGYDRPAENEVIRHGRRTTIERGADVGPGAAETAAAAAAVRRQERGGAAGLVAAAVVVAPTDEGVDVAGRGRRPTAAPSGRRAHGNGTVFVGSKGYMATVGRGEGVDLIPGTRWTEYSLPADAAVALAGPPPRLDPRLQRRRARVLELQHLRSVTEWMVLGAVAYRFDGKL